MQRFFLVIVLVFVLPLMTNDECRDARDACNAKAKTSIAEAECRRICVLCMQEKTR